MDNESMYDRIIGAYENAGLTTSQTGIAKDLGIFQSAVGAWKRGGNVKPGVMRLIAKHTGACMEWLYTGRGPRCPASPDLSALVDRLNTLDEDELKRFWRIADALSDE